MLNFSRRTTRFTLPDSPRDQKAVALLCFTAVPLVPIVLGGSLRDALSGLGLMGLLGLALWYLSEGLKHHEDFDAKPVAQAPVLKRKLVGSGLIAVFACLLVLLSGKSLLGALIAGLMAGGLSVLAFGRDPMVAKGMEDAAVLSGFKASVETAQARARLDALGQIIRALDDTALSAVVCGFSKEVRRLLDAITVDPTRMRNERKYLGLYLEQVEHASQRFADQFLVARSARMEKEYLALLAELTARYAVRADQYLASSETTLRNDMDFLRDRVAAGTRG